MTLSVNRAPGLYCQRQAVRGRQSRGLLLSVNMGLSENCRINVLLVEKFSSKNAKVGAEKHSFWGQIKIYIILSTHNLLCRRFLTVCQKIAASGPTYFFLTYDAAEDKDFFHTSSLTANVKS